jgi:tRNA-guanine family transglycosylase
MRDFSFSIEKKLENGLGRAGVIRTPHGDIETPAFTVVGTLANIKGVTADMLKGIGVEAVLANTYHLYLRPGEDIVKKARGLGTFMNWGELCVLLINHGHDLFEIKSGDRIAQLVVAPVERASWQEVSELDQTERGAGGFGSTGKS